MIKSTKSFYKIIKSNPKRIFALLERLDEYYYEKREIKTDAFGQPKRNSDGSIKYRILLPSKGELKLIQQRIKNIILKQISFPECAYGGIKRKNNILNAKCHKGKKFKFVTDLNKFFPSVKPFQVYNALIKEGFSPDIASLITKLTTYRNQVPQGIPTSTHITNIVFKEIDIEIMKFCKQNSIIYTRFVDDLSFSSIKDFKSITNEILQPVINSGFNISHRKTKFGIGSIEITGIWVRNNKLDVSDKMKEKLAHPESYTKLQNKGNLNYTHRVRSS